MGGGVVEKLTFQIYTQDLKCKELIKWQMKQKKIRTPARSMNF